MPTTSVAQYQRAIQIVEQIAKLEEELKSVLGGVASASASNSGATEVASTGKRRPGRPKGSVSASGGRKRRTMSPEARARIAEAQRKRWAKARGRK